MECLGLINQWTSIVDLRVGLCPWNWIELSPIVSMELDSMTPTGFEPSIMPMLNVIPHGFKPLDARQSTVSMTTTRAKLGGSCLMLFSFTSRILHRNHFGAKE